VKIGPVDTEIALLKVKKEEITDGKIYSPFGKFAERAKKHPGLVASYNIWIKKWRIKYKKEKLSKRKGSKLQEKGIIQYLPYGAKIVKIYTQTIYNMPKTTGFYGVLGSGTCTGLVWSEYIYIYIYICTYLSYL